ncbi:hypothetical protein DPEC_G00309770 [Dallia pectoralis]|uniref:Uncharacterized protein n=1 Tax=Dallia pectoralis TaxID=75939 RepID=A0ACC2FEV2_DALPE|nr:hypothetical protein DPEC_G00309770 [Dallia pectoralis]
MGEVLTSRVRTKKGARKKSDFERCERGYSEFCPAPCSQISRTELCNISRWASVVSLSARKTLVDISDEQTDEAPPGTHRCSRWARLFVYSLHTSIKISPRGYA